MANYDKSDLLKDGLAAFRRCSDAWQKNHDAWLDDMRFARLGEQWPETVRLQREKDGRPCLTINRLPAFIRQVTNDARQNTPSIKFHPVGDGADADTAKVLDGVVRNIEYTSNSDEAYDNALDNAVTGGFGYFRISIDYLNEFTFDKDIVIEPIKNPLTVYGDPMSTKSDSSDWNECFVTEMWPISRFKKQYPDADASSFSADSHDENFGWFDQSNETIRIAEWWTRDDEPDTLVKLNNGEIMLKSTYEDPENTAFFEAQQLVVVEERKTMVKKVRQRIMNGCEILEDNEWPGMYIPIILVCGDEVIVDGERHLLSLVRFAKDSQQMLNFWRTASTELVALAPKAPFIGAVGQFATDGVKWASANTATYSHIEYDMVMDPTGQVPAPPPQRQPFAGPPAGALQEAINASDDMKSIMGLFDASLGAQSNETSGRAILARQREGDVSTFNFTDNLSRAIRHAGRVLCDLIPKVYDAPRILRVIHEDGSTQNVAVNGAQPPAAPADQQQIQGVARSFDLATGKYDVTCETGPSYTTRREEAANQIIEFMRAVPQSAALIGDLLAKNLDWPGAEEIAQRLKAMLPPQLQGQSPEAQAMQQQIGQLTQALQHTQQQLNDKAADRQIDAVKAQIDAYNAETNRLKVTAPAMGPNEIQALVLQTVQQLLQSPDILPSQSATQQPALQQPIPQPQEQPQAPQM